MLGLANILMYTEPPKWLEALAVVLALGSTSIGGTARIWHNSTRREKVFGAILIWLAFTMFGAVIGSGWGFRGALIGGLVGATVEPFFEAFGRLGSRFFSWLAEGG